MTYSEEVLEVLTDRGPRLGGIVMFKETNAVDADMPVGEPLVITGMGTGSAHISYPLHGWDEIGENDPYFIVKSCRGDGVYRNHVVRTSTAHDCFYDSNTVRRAAEDCEPCEY